MHSHIALIVLLSSLCMHFCFMWRFTSSISCSKNGSTRLTGGITDDQQGVLEYCYNGRWSVFCNLDDEEAEVACKQIGYSQFGGNIRQLVHYTCIIPYFSHQWCLGFLSSDEYTWNTNSYTNYTYLLFDYFNCSINATENSLSQCNLTEISPSDCMWCSLPVSKSN